MHARSLSIVTCLVVACGAPSAAPTTPSASPSSPPAAPAQDARGRSQLDFLAGTWAFDGTISGAPLQFLETCEWIAGGYHVQCYTGSPADGFSLIGHQQGVGFTHYSFSLKTPPRVVTGTFDGSVWRFAGSYVKDGKPHEARVTMKMASRDQFSFLYETSAAGEPWKVFLDGTYRRAAAATPPEAP